jgi:hypothetical protein
VCDCIGESDIFYQTNVGFYACQLTSQITYTQSTLLITTGGNEQIDWEEKKRNSEKTAAISSE